MNIFHLDNNPILAARMMLDKHVVKMTVEYAQLMSTAHRVLDGELYVDKTANNRRIKRWRLSHQPMEEMLYKASHINHPSNIWVRESKSNYLWLYEHFKECCKEYTRRYGKQHMTDIKLSDVLKSAPISIPDVGLTEFAQAMPDYCKSKDPVQAYRNYYINEKKHFAKWKTEVPYWWAA